MKETTGCSYIQLAFVLLLAGGFLLQGCVTPNPPATVANVDLGQYAGLWYEISKFPQFFERGLVGVTAEYTLEEDGRVRVVNSGFQGSFDAEKTSVEGYATAPDPTDTAKLRVRFDFFPASLFPADYWIVALGDDYEYAVVSNPKRNTLWILSRTPTMDTEVYEGIVADLATRGFAVENLERMPQTPEQL